MKSIMRKMFSMAAIALGLGIGVANAQGTDLPNTEIKDMATSKKVPFNSIIKPGKVTLISFWATWCAPCKSEILAINKNMPTWKAETDFDYILISQDETKSEGLARSVVKSKGWDYPFYLDANADLKRSLNFESIPFTIIIDQKGEIVYRHTGYEQGHENFIYEKVKEISKQ